jgi:hypothetical protein
LNIDIEVIGDILERTFNLKPEQYRELSDIALEVSGEYLEEMIPMLPEEHHDKIPEDAQVLVSPLEVHGEELAWTFYAFYTNEDKIHAIALVDEDGVTKDYKIFE